MTNITPAEGVYHNIPAPVYFSWDAASSSKLKAFARSPLHCKALSYKADEATDAQQFGTAVHTAVFEPDRFLKDYVVKPEGLKRNTKAGKLEYDALVAEHGENNILSFDDYQHILGMQKAIREDEDTKSLLDKVLSTEVSLLWKQNDIDCKARLDAISGNRIIDLKTTQSASIHSFGTSFFKYGYELQAAHYLSGAKRLRLGVSEFVFIAIEKKPPYALALYKLSPASLEVAMGQVQQLTREYARCKRENVWPGYPKGIQELTLPDWKSNFNNLEEQENEQA